MVDRLPAATCVQLCRSVGVQTLRFGVVRYRTALEGQEIQRRGAALGGQEIQRRGAALGGQWIQRR